MHKFGYWLLSAACAVVLTAVAVGCGGSSGSGGAGTTGTGSTTTGGTTASASTGG